MNDDQDTVVDTKTGEVLLARREPEREVITLEHLAQVIDGDFVQSYADLLAMARRASIAMTEPEDWVLFKRGDGDGARVTAYLQDVGAQRIEDLWQIEVKPPGGVKEFPRERIAADGSDEFAWTMTGDGICHRTGKRVYAIEGVRRSDEDFVKYKKGIQREIEVRKAAFANLHGGIVRRLTGLASVSAELLEEVWKAAGQTRKKVANCAEGKGFGTKSERLGEARQADYGDPPACPKCGKKMVFRPGRDGREPFFGCSDYKTCGQKPITAKLISKPAAPTQERQAGNDTPPEPNGPKGADPTQQATVGQHKYRLQERVAGTPWAKEMLAMILKAKTFDELIDLETLIGDREKGGAH